MLNVDMKKVDGVLYVELVGKLNNLTSKEFADQVQPELEGVQAIVIDAAKLDYISSAGLRVILRLQRHLEDVGGEDVCVRNATPTVLDTLGMTGFRGIINVE